MAPIHRSLVHIGAKRVWAVPPNGNAGEVAPSFRRVAATIARPSNPRRPASLRSIHQDEGLRIARAESACYQNSRLSDLGTSRLAAYKLVRARGHSCTTSRCIPRAAGPLLWLPKPHRKGCRRSQSSSPSKAQSRSDRTLLDPVAQLGRSAC